MMKKRTLLKAVLALLTMATMVSVGGGFVLGLVLLPFHWRAARSASAWGRFLWAGLAAALVAENVWAGYFALFGEALPFIWLTPALSFLVTAIIFLRIPGGDLGAAVTD